MSRLALYLLGPPRLELDGEPVEIGRRRAVALLAYLAVTGAAPQPRLPGDVAVARVRPIPRSSGPATHPVGAQSNAGAGVDSGRPGDRWAEP
jgi:hypothetical protein